MPLPYKSVVFDYGGVLINPITGPIATVAGFETLDQAIALANDSRYGLGAYAFTAHLRTAHRLADELEAGMVGINHFGISQPEMPFGGWKESGHGQEMGAEGLLAYTDLKTVYVGTPDGATN